MRPHLLLSAVLVAIGGTFAQAAIVSITVNNGNFELNNTAYPADYIPSNMAGFFTTTKWNGRLNNAATSNDTGNVIVNSPRDSGFWTANVPAEGTDELGTVFGAVAELWQQTAEVIGNYEYTLSVDVAQAGRSSDDKFWPSNTQLRVYAGSSLGVGSAPIASVTVTAPPTTPSGDGLFATRTLVFTPTSPQLTTYAGQTLIIGLWSDASSSTNFIANFDNVTFVKLVPEPASFSLLGLGPCAFFAAVA